MYNSLAKMMKNITKYIISKLAVPQLGCGIDKLKWNGVKNMLTYIFWNTSIDIVVCSIPNTSSTPIVEKHNTLLIHDNELEYKRISNHEEDPEVRKSVKVRLSNDYLINPEETKEVWAKITGTEDKYDPFISNFLENEKCLVPRGLLIVEKVKKLPDNLSINIKNIMPIPQKMLRNSTIGFLEENMGHEVKGAVVLYFETENDEVTSEDHM
ncbi:hypothetical protein JTB14_027815 [Gonioctena quinquepunctata]|nr:hypothetical protein JTB14_027815 [Gonioctena quinquepunctata]